LVIRRHCWSSWDRRGVTLIEVMLTLCLLAAMAVFTWPLLDNSFASQRLRSAASRIRAQWIKARAEAMNSDTVYLFRYTPEDNRYTVENQIDPDLAAEQNLGDGSGGGSGVQDPSSMPHKTQGVLPEGVVFGSVQVDPDPRADTAMANGDQTGDQDASEADPLFFFPDGTTSNARLRLKNDRGRSIDVMLRGLTGVVTVGDVCTSQGE
jgi:prepilin-type N-terminal cleavage/methylation domain-containing protein